jgi:cytochrome P450
LKPLPLIALKEVFCGNDYLMNYGQEARRISKGSQDDKSIFSFVNKEAEKEGGHLDETDVLLESQALLVAGSDTTAISRTYLVWAVLSHPTWQRELEDEVGALQPDFTDADLEKLPVLSAVIGETLRLYGAAPGGLPRVVPEGGARMNGYHLPAGTTVSTQSYTLHRNAELFPQPYKYVLCPLTATPKD